MEKIAHVTAVEGLGSHRLRLCFDDDGISGELDSADGERLGTIIWPNGVDMAPETLHRMLSERT